MEGITFPSAKALPDGFWQPVFFRANFDTPERLVAAVIANVDGTWSLQTANALERLKCLYGNESVVAIAAVETGLRDLEQRLRNGDNIDDGALSVSGLELGARTKAQGHDATFLATRWLQLISSLHDRRRELALFLENREPAARTDPIVRDISRDRLPVIIMDLMTERVPKARNMFNQHVHRLQKDTGARLLTHKAYVAYDGQKVAANFTTLRAGRNKPSVDVAKRLMWDLEQHRDKSESLYERQTHEMFLYHPAKNDPTISEKQFENVMTVVDTLTSEGTNRDIKVTAKDNVDEISETLLREDGLLA